LGFDPGVPHDPGIFQNSLYIDPYTLSFKKYLDHPVHAVQEGFKEVKRALLKKSIRYIPGTRLDRNSYWTYLLGFCKVYNRKIPRQDRCFFTILGIGTGGDGGTPILNLEGCTHTDSARVYVRGQHGQNGLQNWTTKEQWKLYERHEQHRGSTAEAIQAVNF